MKSKVCNEEAALAYIENQKGKTEALEFKISNCSWKEVLDYDQILAPYFSSIINLCGVVIKSDRSLRLSDGDITEGLRNL